MSDKGVGLVGRDSSRLSILAFSHLGRVVIQPAINLQFSSRQLYADRVKGDN
jgi:hypothetical protein